MCSFLLPIVDRVPLIHKFEVTLDVRRILRQPLVGAVFGAENNNWTHNRVTHTSVSELAAPYYFAFRVHPISRWYECEVGITFRDPLVTGGSDWHPSRWSPPWHMR